MTFTLGLDLGIVMAKGVVIGVIGCVTILPSMILTFDRALEKTMHKEIMPAKFDKLANFVVNHAWLPIIVFLYYYSRQFTDIIIQMFTIT